MITTSAPQHHIRSTVVGVAQGAAEVRCALNVAMLGSLTPDPAARVCLGIHAQQCLCRARAHGSRTTGLFAHLETASVSEMRSTAARSERLPYLAGVVLALS